MVVGVAIDQTPERVRAFRERWGVTYPIWIDRQRRLYDQYAAVRLPIYNVLLDARHNLVAGGPEMYLENFTAHLARLTKPQKAAQDRNGDQDEQEKRVDDQVD